ncbi:hypothetical protein K9O81_18865 [Leclercia adecarboxylata]|uniref:hypothetical protein n=1 Tax=Leclercia adecarboxylata TaxID=83655 RepID=UPI001CC0DB34|nr:hypothetical protein [Leclercia adecarboxylata]MBZ3802433.1 hypothetical protein [Leclercia adecarboxylata]MBZ3807069.1 hypothetical protein [Leclercia adecarboxylata]UVN08024.1 MAG: hypothetical protein [Bacteriophage sp.]
MKEIFWQLYIALGVAMLIVETIGLKSRLGKYVGDYNSILNKARSLPPAAQLLLTLVAALLTASAGAVFITVVVLTWPLRAAYRALRFIRGDR